MPLAKPSLTLLGHEPSVPTRDYLPRESTIVFAEPAAPALAQRALVPSCAKKATTLATSTSTEAAGATSRWELRAGLIFGPLTAAGCSTPAVRSQSPEDLEAAAAADVRLIGDIAVPYGMYPI